MNKRLAEVKQSYLNGRLTEDELRYAVQELELTDEDRHELFKNAGIINGLYEQDALEFRFMQIVHRVDSEKHPDLHKMTQKTPYTCYNVYSCACGFGFSIDSSD